MKICQVFSELLIIKDTDRHSINYQTNNKRFVISGNPAYFLCNQLSIKK